MEVTIVGKLSLQSIKLIERFRKMEIGDTVGVEEITALIGEDCGPDGSGRGKVGNAIKRLRKEHQINIRWDKNTKVWKRTNDAETAAHTDEDRRRTRRCAMRGIERSKCVSVAKLNEEEAAEFRATSTQLAMATIALDNETRKRFPKADHVIDTERLLLSIRPVGR